MARLSTSQTLSIVIPSFNEASNLPLLLADLNLWPHPLEICICDACSSDLTELVAKLGGAKLIQILEANRGLQLHYGATNTSGEWILFLHADCRIPGTWPEALSKIINRRSSKDIAWFFDFKVQSEKVELKLLEIAVSIRSNFLKKPYGDQGLLIKRSLYKEMGGYKPLSLMEDLEFIERITKKIKIKRIGLPLYCDSRRWDKNNFIVKAFENAKLRRRWRRGESSKKLACEYYKKNTKVRQ
ncbi:TIGR04283 family arsenosugar biosynthesis glycosyltransferase [Prochlorococcus sp. MIT 1307]|uniref:TIGR04283 family arsenosugar biosynthesis glycosyltransferase n=1 Tax=Prochlorococcus sp. MIT 1307 TaxID=3096219 RepID=UPI002A761FDB|nr:TIGR04283 family arsenosugar biosynthesis glycosyltransferase [Prochlorococcus sp. MIT 1307]